ncbi:MAG: hypothetical protein AABX89_03200 [Candidatus Thermoplasmatota archaeon]
MTRKEWAKRQFVRALILLPAGLGLLLIGAIALGKRSTTLGLVAGLLGVFAITFGALAGRLAVAGPYPAHLAVPADDASEVDA